MQAIIQKIHPASLFIIIFYIPFVIAQDADKPLADWGVYTIISSGPKIWEGNKIRAVLIYGETGFPKIVLESIHVEEGRPIRSRVLWTKNVEVTGGLEICPPAETRCGEISNLTWEQDELHYDINSNNKCYSCIVRNINKGELNTECNLTPSP